MPFLSAELSMTTFKSARFAILLFIFITQNCIQATEAEKTAVFVKKFPKIIKQQYQALQQCRYNILPRSFFFMTDSWQGFLGLRRANPWAP